MAKDLLDTLLYGAPKRKVSRILSRRQNALLRALCDPNTRSIAEAGRVAGYTSPGVAVAATHTPSMQSALSNFLMTLESCGITNEKLAEKISEGLSAEETKLVTYEGQITDERGLVDYATRHKYIETALRLKRLLDTKSEEESKAPVNIMIVNYDKTASAG